MSSASGLRERRIAETSARLTALARRWTAERGFGGFTIDELCDDVGVSRRTFFNYFASKEDAVLGATARADDAHLVERFLDAEPGEGGAPSASLLTDLAELMVSRWEARGIAARDVEAVVAAIAHAPRLLTRAMQMTREQEAGDIELVERREHLAAGDLLAGTAVQLLGGLLRAAVEETFLDGGARPLRDAFLRRLAAARTVFTA